MILFVREDREENLKFKKKSFHCKYIMTNYKYSDNMSNNWRYFYLFDKHRELFYWIGTYITEQKNLSYVGVFIHWIAILLHEIAGFRLELCWPLISSLQSSTGSDRNDKRSALGLVEKLHENGLSLLRSIQPSELVGPLLK